MVLIPVELCVYASLVLAEGDSESTLLSRCEDTEVNTAMVLLVVSDSDDGEVRANEC